MHFTRTQVFVALVLGLAMLASPVLLAQRVLHSSVSGVNQTSSLLDLATGLSVRLSNDFTSRAVFTADGEFVVRTVTLTAPAFETRVRHIASGVEARLPVPFQPEVAHPRALAIFGTVNNVLTRLDPNGLTSWSPCGSGVNASFRLSADGTQLFSICPNGHFVSIDSASGSVMRDTPIAEPAAISSFVPSPDGSQAVVVRQLSGGTVPTFELARIDTMSGATLVSRPSAPLGLAQVPGGTRFLTEICPPTSPTNPRCFVSLGLFESVETTPLTQVAPLFSHFVVTEDGREAYVSSSPRLLPQPLDTVELWSLESGQLIGSVTAPSVWVAGVASVPRPVIAFAAQVSGATVSLSWQPPRASAAATSYRLAVGSMPGAIDLASIRLGSADTFTAVGVPSGRYYVRLYAVNVTGESAPSAELVVDVP
jgi:hypothetical protein